MSNCNMGENKKWLAKRKNLTIATASSTSSLFLPATRPLKASSASLSFFRSTCFSHEAASLSLACIQGNKNVEYCNSCLNLILKLIFPSFNPTKEQTLSSIGVWPLVAFKFRSISHYCVLCWLKTSKKTKI